MYFLQSPEIVSYTIITVVTPQYPVEIQYLFTDRQMTQPSHLFIQAGHTTALSLILSTLPLFSWHMDCGA